jgi:hypothetical protein
MEYDVHRVPLDPNTADRLLAGTVAPEDAPPGYVGVARLLEATWSEPTAEELAGEEEIVAMIAAVVRSPTSIASPSRRRRSRRRFMPALSRPRVAALVAAGLACGAGLATAGTLPGVVQDLASAGLAKVGISVPGGDDEAATSPGEHRASAVTPSRAAVSVNARKAKRAEARKGSAISAAPRNAKGDAGQRGSASGAPSDTAKNDEISGPARQTTRTAPVPVPATPATSTGKSQGGPQRSAALTRRPVAPASGSTRAPDTARKRRSSAGTSTTRRSGSAGGAQGSGNASSGQQGGAVGSGGQGTGGSGNPGNGGQGGDPANGGAGSGGSGNGDTGRGRP